MRKSWIKLKPKISVAGIHHKRETYALTSVLTQGDTRFKPDTGIGKKLALNITDA